MSFNVDNVRNAWETQQRAVRKAARETRLALGESWQAVDDDTVEMYSYVKEIWSDFVIVDGENQRKTNRFWKIPYTVNDKGDVAFGKRQAVKQEYVALSAGSPLWENPEGPAVSQLKLRLKKA